MWGSLGHIFLQENTRVQTEKPLENSVKNQILYRHPARQYQ